MTSNADPATVALANGAGPFLCVAGDPDYIAASVPLQQMPCEKLASHPYSKDHRSPCPPPQLAKNLSSPANFITEPKKAKQCLSWEGKDPF